VCQEIFESISGIPYCIAGDVMFRPDKGCGEEHYPPGFEYPMPFGENRLGMEKMLQDFGGQQAVKGPFAQRQLHSIEQAIRVFLGMRRGVVGNIDPDDPVCRQEVPVGLTTAAIIQYLPGEDVSVTFDSVIETLANEIVGVEQQ
jgi:hypothetical protein